MRPPRSDTVDAHSSSSDVSSHPDGRIGRLTPSGGRRHHSRDSLPSGHVLRNVGSLLAENRWRHSGGAHPLPTLGRDWRRPAVAQPGRSKWRVRPSRSNNDGRTVTVDGPRGEPLDGEG